MTLNWIIGFVWGIGTISDDRLYIRYHDDELLLKIAKTVATASRPYHPTTGKTAIRMSLSNVLPQTLLRLGWTGRFDGERTYPVGDINDIDFIRGYCYTKASLGTWVHKNHNGDVLRTPRLRIWGSRDIVYRIDQYLAVNLTLSPKKPFLHKGATQDGYKGECWCVQYLSQREVPIIASLLGVNQRGTNQLVSG